MKSKAYLLKICFCIVLIFNFDNLTKMVDQIQLPRILLIDFLFNTKTTLEKTSPVPLIWVRIINSKYT